MNPNNALECISCGAPARLLSSSPVMRCDACGKETAYDEWCRLRSDATVPKRSVWYRTRVVSYTREMPVADLMPDGTVRGQDAWWEPWGV